MLSPGKNRIYISIIIIIGITVLVPLIFIASSNRESFIHFILHHLQRPYLSGILEQKIITVRKFIWLKYISYALILCDVALMFLLYNYRVKVLRFLHFVYQSFYSVFRSLKLIFKISSKKENIVFCIFLVIIFLRGLYYISVTNLQYDEIWCYNYYTSRPFYLNFFSFSTYPLYELITHAFKWLPFPTKINLRLPSLLAGLFTCVIIYACTKKITNNFLTALACMILFISMPFTTCYMLYGKGVSIELFFAVISFFCAIFFLKESNYKKYLLLFIVANVAGMYAMPTHIYFWMLQFIFGVIYVFWYRKSLMKSFLFANGLILLFSFFCYTPVLLGSGISFVTNIFWGYPHLSDPWPNIISFIGFINWDFTGTYCGLVIALLVAAFVLIITKKFKKEYLFLFAFGFFLLLLPAPIKFVQHIYIPDRSVAFIGLIIPLCVFIVFFLLRNLIGFYFRSALLLFLFVGTCIVSHFHPFRFWSAKFDENAITISNLLMEHHVTNCYDNASSTHFFYYYPALEYYYGKKQMNIDLYMAAQKSLRYKTFSSADNYDCIVDSISSANYLNGYETIYTNPEERFKILVRKEK
jgi:hypothetical protein